MTRADERFQRLLMVLPMMAEESTTTLAQLASRVGTDAKTLREDFRCLERDDTPPGFVESIQLYLGSDRVSMRSAHFKRPMRLTRPEVASLELGLGILEQELPIDEQHVVVNVRARLRDIAVRPVDTVVDRRKASMTADASGGMAIEPARDTEWDAVLVLQRAQDVQALAQPRTGSTGRDRQLGHHDPGPRRVTVREPDGGPGGPVRPDPHRTGHAVPGRTQRNGQVERDGVGFHALIQPSAGGHRPLSTARTRARSRAHGPQPSPQPTARPTVHGRRREPQSSRTTRPSRALTTAASSTWAVRTASSGSTGTGPPSRIHRPTAA